MKYLRTENTLLKVPKNLMKHSDCTSPDEHNVIFTMKYCSNITPSNVSSYLNIYSTFNFHLKFLKLKVLGTTIMSLSS